MPASPVAILSTRAMTDADALCLADALQANAGVGSIILDAGLQARLPSQREATLAGDAGGEAAPAALVGRLRSVLLGNEITRAAVLARGIAQDTQRMRKLVAQQRPSVLVAFDDRRVRPDLVALKVARRHGIPTVVVPFAVSTLESDLFMRRDRGELIVGRPPWRRLKQHIADRLPKQVQPFGDGRLVTFFTPVETLVLDCLGLLPERAWVWGGSGSADRVCALGADHRAYLVEGGVDASRVVTTGQPSLDRLAMPAPAREKLKRRLTVRYGLDPTAPLVMCAVPQYGEHQMTDWATHWRLTEELLAALAGSGNSILLSLHPKSKRADYETRAGRHGLRILDERLADVLPAADLLVGTFSSTIGWAIGLGIPAIVVDSLQSCYRLFRDLEGVDVVDDHEALRQHLTRLSSDATVLPLRRAAALRGSARVGAINGGNSARVARVIAELASAASGVPDASFRVPTSNATI